MANKNMGDLGTIEIRQFYLKPWHRLLRRITTEVKHKDTLFYFDSRTKNWSGTL